MPNKKSKKGETASTLIRLSPITRKKLTSLKRGGESYDKLIKRSMLKPKRRRK